MCVCVRLCGGVCLGDRVCENVPTCMYGLDSEFLSVCVSVHVCVRVCACVCVYVGCVSMAKRDSIF